jgi:hypothetical protein
LVEPVTDYAIYMLDPTGMVTSWNAGAQRFKGCESHEILGQYFSRFYTEEDQRSGLPRGSLFFYLLSCSMAVRTGALEIVM